MYKLLTEISRPNKMLLVLAVDAVVILVAITLAIILRTSDPWPAELLARSAPFYLVITGLGIWMANALGVPLVKISAFDLQAASKIGLFALILSAVSTAMNIALPLGAPRTAPMIFGVLMFCLALGWRLVAYTLLDWMRQATQPMIDVAVYGAGAAGMQLISTLLRSGEFRVAAVVDDNPNLRGVIIAGRRVEGPEILEELVQKGRIERILLALPSLSGTRQHEIVKRLEALPCDVQALPSYVDIVRRGAMSDEMDLTKVLKPVSSDDLLGRNSVDLDSPEIARAYQGKSILISGAGGSIGSELCRQILTCRPRRLVMLERSEFALYTIDQELRPVAEAEGIEIHAVLGSVGDRLRVERTLERFGIEIVLHAAAYKHVPLVEENELEGVRNNVFGTLTLAEAAEAAGVERFILVSTDKAVRPTNVMGATKRVAEMVVQDLARRSRRTMFAMVRFGNVLGSSGSVIPLFKSQIASGGPVTLTDPRVTRFFMTVSEASRLVLLAGSYADGGDLFVLDMGEPVRILDLARRMIELSGLTVRDDANPDGDIAIAVTGLRRGEKLFEELLIDNDGLLATPHPKILRAGESCPTPSRVSVLLDELRRAMEADDAYLARNQVLRIVEGDQGAHLAPQSVAAE